MALENGVQFNAHFNLDPGITIDTSGLGNDITLFGPFTVPGLLDEGLGFDNTDDRGEINGLLTQLANDTVGQVAFWAFIPSTGVISTNTIFDIGSTTGLTFMQFEVNTSSSVRRVTVTCRRDGTQKFQMRTPNGVLALDAWNLFICKQDGASIKIKINNVLQAQVPAGAQPEPGIWFKSILTDATLKSDVVSLGVHRESGGFFSYSGLSNDEFTIWNRLTTDDEDTEFWNGGAGLQLFPPPAPRRALFLRQYQHLLPNSKAFKL